MDVDTVKAALANGSVKDEALAAVRTGTVTVVDDARNTKFLMGSNLVSGITIKEGTEAIELTASEMIASVVWF